MIEEWALASAGDAAGRSRMRRLLDAPPPPDPLHIAPASSGGSTPRARRGTGISLAEAQRMARDADQYDRSMGAG